MMKMNEETSAVLLGDQRQVLLFLRSPRVLMAVFRFQPREGRSRVLGIVLPGLDSLEVAEVQAGKFDCAIVPYDPASMTIDPWLMRHHWDNYHGRHAVGGPEHDLSNPAPS
jgi:hypothetical protein